VERCIPAGHRVTLVGASTEIQRRIHRGGDIKEADASGHGEQPERKRELGIVSVEIKRKQCAGPEFVPQRLAANVPSDYISLSSSHNGIMEYIFGMHNHISSPEIWK